GGTKVLLTPELLSSVAAARTRYRIHLENERRKKASKAKGQRRRAMEEHLEQLKKSKMAIQEVSEVLTRDADKLANEAEAKQAGSKIAELRRRPVHSEEATRRSLRTSRTWMNRLQPMHQSSEDRRLLCH
ncbi:hypothetical protein ILYODFUR_026035, partial [Ilyodon furcidens]